jgi:hypothetical protein
LHGFGVNGARKLTPFRRLKIDPLPGMAVAGCGRLVLVFGPLQRLPERWPAGRLGGLIVDGWGWAG